MSVFSHFPELHVLVFDSGVGGLSVSREIRALMQDVRQSYLADDAFRPYGEKSEAQLRTRLPGLLKPVCDMLRPDVVVIACNTASTTALPVIRAVLDCPVVGVVPAIKPAAAGSKTKQIAVLGTPGTVQRTYVDDLIARHAADCSVTLVGNLTLVAEAEAKLSGRPVNMKVIREAVRPILDAQNGAAIDAIVLACTHFPLLRDELQSVTEQTITWIDSGAAIARRVKSLLKNATPRACPPTIQTAFLTGPDESPARRETFRHYGFSRLVSLVE